MWLRVEKSPAPEIGGTALVLWSSDHPCHPCLQRPFRPQPLVLPLLSLQPRQNLNLFATSTSHYRDQDNITTLLLQLILGVYKFPLLIFYLLFYLITYLLISSLLTLFPTKSSSIIFLVSFNCSFLFLALLSLSFSNCQISFAKLYSPDFSLFVPY